MRPVGRRPRVLGVVSLAAVACLVLAGSTLAESASVESCAYDPVAKTVSATIASGGEASLVVSAGALWFGSAPAPCGAATTANTDSIVVSGAGGSNERLVLDQRGGSFGPGASAEANVPEIEIAASLGDATDTVVVYGTTAGDAMAAGQNGLALNTDGDLDVTLSPSALVLEVHLLAGDDYFNGRGQSGAGQPFLGPITVTGGDGNESLLRGSFAADVIDGGSGTDVLQGQEGNDRLDGGPGDDTLAGGDGDDDMIGGGGGDSFSGSAGNDAMNAQDGEADSLLNGGPGTDTAYVDARIDPKPTATEAIFATPESCAYNPTTRAVTASMTPGSTASLRIVGSEIWFGVAPTACAGATTTNTDSISVTGGVGTRETLVLDQRGGFFGPGYTPEFNTPEIEIDTALGDLDDHVIVYGTEGADYMAAGQNGLATSGDGDLDVTFAPNGMPLEVHLLGGDDFFDARGTGGAGLHYLGPVTLTGGDGDDSLLRGGSNADVISGGAGDDQLDAQEGDDTLDGGPGNDTLIAGGGNDAMTGGPGIDSFSAGDGDDTMQAQDDEADSQLSGGAGADTAYVDTGLDPAPVAVENVIGDGPPPPPPALGCSYDPASRVVTATLTAGSEGTLVVVGNEIWFGATPAACGGATTSNTDLVSVAGATGSDETLVVDLSGGAFAPGATAEATGTSEVEISVGLGDVTDRVVISGTAGADRISVGTNGMAVNADGDADVTFSPLPGVVEARGLGAADTLSALGGLGSGTPFPGRAILHGGDDADSLTGGLGDDEILGGAGDDVLSGRDGNDTIDGEAGADTVSGNNGDDHLSGGAGADSLIAGDGTDTMRADDDEPDTNVNGGAGADTAYYDAGIDPTPTATETLVPA